MGKYHINTFQNKRWILIGQRVPSLVRIRFLLALLCFVFSPIRVEGTAFSLGQVVPEFQRSNVMLLDPLAWHADSRTLFTLHVELGGMKGGPEFVGSIVEPSYPVSINGHSVSDKVAYQGADNGNYRGPKGRVDGSLEKIQEESPTLQHPHVLVYLAYWAIGIVVGCSLGWILTHIYDWVRCNLT